MIHTVAHAQEVIALLNQHGIQAALIGSLSKVGVSEHDIDIHILSPDSPELRDKIVDILSPHAAEPTDWDGIYCERTHFGDVDVFFVHPDEIIV